MQSLYARIRKNGASAERAFIQAKERKVAGVQWWKIPNLRPMIEYNKASDDGLRWIEHASAGLRFKGYADKQGARGIQHTGWYTSEDNCTGETLRGVVYQLPARDGKPQYIPGYIESENFDETGGARLDFSDIRTCEIEAACAADKLAERAAEKEREYQEAWRAGSDYAQAWEELSAERKATLALIRDVKAEKARGASDTICNALRGVIRSSLRDIARLKEKRAQLVDDFSAAWRAEYYSAFNEGAGSEVLS